MKNKILLIFILLSFGLYESQVKKSPVAQKPPKIGLALSGGGAKGFAHIGVLKVIDSLGIKIDYISGTSMGAIVGGLYAAGYEAKDIEKIMKETDFYTLLANEKPRQETPFFSKTNDKYLITVPIHKGKINVLPKAISTGQKNLYLLKELLSNVSNINNFSELQIPFLCVATNLESGKMEIFEKGDIVSSIMASSAYPSLMDPVKVGDSLYVDGAMTVNFPAKPLKDKGMDIIIGVNLSQPLADREELNSAVKILNQVIDFNTKRENISQEKYADILINPNLSGYSTTSFDEKEKILNIGYKTAKQFTEVLNQLPKREHRISRAPINPIYSNIYKVDSLAVENNRIFNRDYIQGKMALKTPSLQTYKGINKMIDKLYATNNYNLINYELLLLGNKNVLKLEVDEIESRYFLKFGLHYDEVFKTGLLMNLTIKRLLLRNSVLSADVIVGGTHPRYYFNYFVDNGYIPGLGIYASGMSLELRDSHRNLIGKWKWFRNEAYIQSVWRDKYAIGGGISHDYFESKSGVARYDNERNFINPYVFIKTDTRDDKDFPTKGFSLDARGKLLDLFDKKIENQIFQIKGDLETNFAFSNRFTYRLHLFAGFSFGEPLTPYYQFYPGGIFEQNLANFVSFPGYQFGSFSANNLVIARNDFQFKIKKNYFITGHFNILNTFNEHNAKSVFKFGDVSGGITLGYKSPFGQVKLNFSKAADRSKGVFSVILGHWF